MRWGGGGALRGSWWGTCKAGWSIHRKATGRKSNAKDTPSYIADGSTVHFSFQRTQDKRVRHSAIRSHPLELCWLVHPYRQWHTIDGCISSGSLGLLLYLGGHRMIVHMRRAPVAPEGWRMRRAVCRLALGVTGRMQRQLHSSLHM